MVASTSIARDSLWRRHPTMRVVDVLDQNLVQNQLQVAAMVAAVTSMLSQFLGYSLLPVQRAQIQAAIQYGFVNLYQQVTDGWIFYERRTAYSTNYRYNIFFAVQNSTTGNFVFGAPVGMDIIVNRDYERVLFHYDQG